MFKPAAPRERSRSGPSWRLMSYCCLAISINVCLSDIEQASIDRWRSRGRSRGHYYSLAVRRFQTILGVGSRIYPHFRGGLRLTNHGTMTENRSFFARFSVFMHFHKRITVLEVAVSV